MSKPWRCWLYLRGMMAQVPQADVNPWELEVLESCFTLQWTKVDPMKASQTPRSAWGLLRLLLQHQEGNIHGPKDPVCKQGEENTPDSSHWRGYVLEHTGGAWRRTITLVTLREARCWLREGVVGGGGSIFLVYELAPPPPPAPHLRPNPSSE